MGFWSSFFGSSNIEEPNGKTDWLGNPVNDHLKEENRWWGDNQQSQRAAEEGGTSPFDGWF